MHLFHAFTQLCQPFHLNENYILMNHTLMWLYQTDMMGNKYNNLQNLSENKFDHMSKGSLPIFVILMITHHKTMLHCYKTYKAYIS